MKISRIGLAVGAGMAVSAAITPVKAADLGGGCCADLEERVAELEATTARKGNRVVSLQVYGQVNKALLIWDDGIDSDAYVVDGTLASSRFGMIGKAAISPGFTAGYNIEFELLDARADEVTNNDANTATFPAKQGDEGFYDGGLHLRQNNFYVESDKYGRITVGHASVAATGAAEVVLGNSLRTSDSNIGAALGIRSKQQPQIAQGYLNNGDDQWAWNYDGGNTYDDKAHNDIIRYDSPTIYGFVLSGSWGDNDYADVALRFKKDFGTVRLGAAIAYMWDGQEGEVNLGNPNRDDDYNSETVKGSISAMHMPTGLYAAFSAGSRDFKSQTMQDDSFWYIQAGIERKFLPYGSTTIYGEYGEYDNFSKVNSIVGNNVGFNDSQATRWGLGINQKIDAAAMDIYAHATFWSFDDNIAKSNNLEYEDLSTILIGSRIQF